VGLGESDGLRQPASAGFSGLAHHDGRRRFLFNDDLHSEVGASEQTGEVANRFVFRDTNRCHTDDDTSIVDINAEVQSTETTVSRWMGRDKR